MSQTRTNTLTTSACTLGSVQAHVVRVFVLVWDILAFGHYEAFTEVCLETVKEILIRLLAFGDGDDAIHTLLIHFEQKANLADWLGSWLACFARCGCCHT